MQNFIKQHKQHLILFTILLLVSISSLIFLISDGNKTSEIPASAGMTDERNSSIPQNNKDMNDLINDVVYSVEDTTKEILKQVQDDSEEMQNDNNKPIINERDPSIPQDDNNEEDYSLLYTPYFLSVNNEEYNLNIAETKDLTVYGLMQLLTASSQKPFMFKTKEYAGMGHFVTSINGIENNPKENQYWIYFINEESAKTGISNYIIKENDQISWKFEENKF